MSDYRDAALRLRDAWMARAARRPVFVVPMAAPLTPELLLRGLLRVKPGLPPISAPFGTLAFREQLTDLVFASTSERES